MILEDRRLGLIGSVGAVIAATVLTVAAPARAQAQDNVPTGRTCTITALADVVDHTANVSGGGSVYCSGPVDPINPFAITVTLYRNGTRVAADAAVCGPGVPGCFAAVDVTDSWAGQQRWQAKVLVQGSYSGTKNSDIFLH